MEKYGVETQRPLVKTADESAGKCPVCNKTLLKGQTPRCPEHGTRPFEDIYANKSSTAKPAGQS